MGDNSKHAAVGVGTVLIQSRVDDAWINGRLEDVLFIPNFGRNLYSTNVATGKGLNVVFVNDKVQITDPTNGAVYAEGKKGRNNICSMNFKVVNIEANACSFNLFDLHRALGHANADTLEKMVRLNSVGGLELTGEEPLFCEGCRFGKAHRNPSRKVSVDDLNYDVGECVHVDLCGPIHTSLGGASYFMLMKDKVSGYRHVYFLKHKSDAPKYSKYHIMMLNNVHRFKLKRIRCDNGLEFVNVQMKEFLSKNGIQLCLSAPYCPEQNGFIERDNRTVVESARTMLHDENVPEHLWAEAVNTAVYAVNRTISVNSGAQTPYELWFGEKPKII